MYLKSTFNIKLMKDHRVLIIMDSSEIALVIQNKINEFKNSNIFLHDKSDFFVFISYILYKQYFDFKNTNDISKIADYIISSEENAPINFMFTQTLSSEEKIDLVIGKINNSRNCSQEQIYIDIRNTVDWFKNLQKKYENDKEDLSQQIIDIFEEYSNSGIVQFTFLYPYLTNDNNYIDIGKVKEYFDFCTKDCKDWFCDTQLSDQIINEILNEEQYQDNFIISDYIKIESKDILKHSNNAIIANISAYSLKELYDKYENKLLEANIRNYIKNKNIDSDIKNTIENSPQSFWYLNNGITIVCNRFEEIIDELKIKLFNFSIVNGGQTTYLISKFAKKENDFYLVCKIIASKNLSNIKIDLNEIAKASNSQKPIKEYDLYSTRNEQSLLKKYLSDIGVEYITKRGPKKHIYSNYYDSTTIDKSGLILMASLLQMPGYGRSNKKMVFSKSRNYYNLCFPNDQNLLKNHARIIEQILKIEDAYKQYLKIFDKTKPSFSYAKNARTMIISLVSLLSRIANKTINVDELVSKLNSDKFYKYENNLEEFFADDVSFNHIYNFHIDIYELQNKLFPLFNILVQYGYLSYKNDPISNTVTETNYLKSNDSYIKLLKYINDKIGLQKLAEQFFPF